MSDLKCPYCNNRPPKRPLVRIVATTEAKEFREQAQHKLPVAPVDGPVEVYCTFFVDRVSSDVDNRIKGLLDAMKGRLLHDDTQVAELHVVKVVTDDEDKVGVVVEVRPADPLEHRELSRRLALSAVGARAAEAKQSKMFGETPTGGGSKPPDSRGGGHTSPRPRVVPPESMQERFARLARSAVVPNRPPEEPEEP